MRTTILLLTALISLSACGPQRAKFLAVLSNHCEYRVEPNVAGRWYRILDPGVTDEYEVEVVVERSSTGNVSGPYLRYGRAPVTGRNVQTGDPLDVRMVGFQTNRPPTVVFCEGGDGRVRVHYKLANQA